MNDRLERIASLNIICNCLKEKSNMVEIGVLCGNSTLIFNDTKKFKNIYCIDPWISGYDSNDCNSFIDMDVVEKEFDKNTSHISHIIKIKDTSINANLNWDKNILLDLVYIDGCHIYESVKEDISIWMKYIKPGGIIAGHDYGKHENWTEFPGVKKAVDEIFGTPDMILSDTSWYKSI